MRKIYSLLAFLFCGLLLQAQTSPQVNFTVALTGNVAAFTNTSVLPSDSTVKKAHWSFGDATPIIITGPLAGITHTYSLASTYQVCLKIYKYTGANLHDSTLIGSKCESVTIQQRCESGFQWTDSLTANPLVHYVKFFGSAGNNAGKVITQVCWNFGDGKDTCIAATAGAVPPLNIVHKYSQNGTYNVCLKVTFDGGCVAEKCNPVTLTSPTIADSCSANFAVQSTSASLLGRRFVAQPWHSNGKKPVRICWNFGDGKDTCIQYATSYTGDYVVEHLYAAYGQYNVCVTIKYDGGCEKQKCNSVSVAQSTPTTCSFDLAEAATASSSLERKFYVGLMQNAVAQKICWNFGDGTDTCVILSNPLNAQQLMITHHYAAPGNYNVCAKVTYVGGCTAERCRIVSITVPYNNLCGGYMSDSLVSSNTVRFKGTAISNPGDNAISYNWTFGDGTTGSGQVLTHSYASSGNKSVCLYIKLASGCETKICKTVSVAGNAQPQLVLTPNPVVNQLNAAFTSLFQQTVTVKIYNANGVMVRSYVRAANTGVNNWSFTDVGTLPTGVYSVIVQSANQFATAIFFKQ